MVYADNFHSVKLQNVDNGIYYPIWSFVIRQFDSICRNFHLGELQNVDNGIY